MDIPPSQTIYVNNLPEKIKKDGARPLGPSRLFRCGWGHSSYTDRRSMRNFAKDSSRAPRGSLYAAATGAAWPRTWRRATLAALRAP